MSDSILLQKQPTNKSVPVLITWDVDPDLWIAPEKRLAALNTAIDLCQDLGIHATFFFTAQGADIYHAEMRKMMDQRHEVGCHGLTHEDEEDYDRMPVKMQSTCINQATEQLSALTGAPIRAFRSPRVKTSASTLKILSDHGYTSDSSVCSQRADLVSSNLINPGWLFAPRRPYHPHSQCPYRAGELPIWEIPISALGLPFISSSLRVLGLSAMKLFFRILLIEARRTAKPVIYLAHPVEFRARFGYYRKISNFARAEYYSPVFIRKHGFRQRNLLYRLGGEPLVSATSELFRYMASFPDIRFLSASEYVAQISDLTLNNTH